MYGNLIKKLNRFTKTDTDYLFKNGFLMVIAQFINSVIIMGLAIMFANFVSKETYGTYQYLLTIGEITALFTMTGISLTLTKSVAQGNDGDFVRLFKTSLLWNIPAAVIGLAVGMYYYLNDDLVFALGALLVGISIPLINSLKLSFSFLRGKQNFISLSVANILSVLVPAIGLSILIYYSTNTPIVLITGYICGHILTNAGIFLYTLKKISNYETSQSSQEFSQHLTFLKIISGAAGQIDKLLVFQFVGPAALAEYLFAIAVPRQIQHSFKSLRSIVLPKVSQRNYETLKETLLKKVFLLYLFVIPTTIIYIFTAPYIFNLLFQNYSSSVLYSQVFSLVFLLMPLNVLKDALIGHEKTKQLYIENVLTSTLKVSTTLVLCSLFGVWGVIGSTLITNTFSVLLIVYLFKK